MRAAEEPVRVRYYPSDFRLGFFTAIVARRPVSFTPAMTARAYGLMDAISIGYQTPVKPSKPIKTKPPGFWTGWLIAVQFRASTDSPDR